MRSLSLSFSLSLCFSLFGEWLLRIDQSSSLWTFSTPDPHAYSVYLKSRRDVVPWDSIFFLLLNSDRFCEIWWESVLAENLSRRASGHRPRSCGLKRVPHRCRPRCTPTDVPLEKIQCSTFSFHCLKNSRVGICMFPICFFLDRIIQDFCYSYSAILLRRNECPLFCKS